MAKVRNNIFVRGLSGDLGNQFTVRASRDGGTTVSAKTDFENDREPSEAQKAHQLNFRDAIFYGQSMKGQEIYRIKADGTGKSPFNLAVADWFHAPEIIDLDLSGWNGLMGEPIRVRAHDDIKVTHVIIRILDAMGNLQEEGQATETGALWWDYATRGNHVGAMTVHITATDLPGNQTEMNKEKTISE